MTEGLSPIETAALLSSPSQLSSFDMTLSNSNTLFLLLLYLSFLLSMVWLVGCAWHSRCIWDAGPSAPSSHSLLRCLLKLGQLVLDNVFNRLANLLSSFFDLNIVLLGIEEGTRICCGANKSKHEQLSAATTLLCILAFAVFVLFFLFLLLLIVYLCIFILLLFLHLFGFLFLFDSRRWLFLSGINCSRLTLLRLLFINDIFRGIFDHFGNNGIHSKSLSRWWLGSVGGCGGLRLSWLAFRR